MRLLLSIFFIAMALSGCGRDDGRENCASEATAKVIASQIQAIFEQDLWLKGKIDIAVSDARTTKLDEKVALATCQASLKIKPPKDVAELLGAPTGVNWLKENSLQYESKTRELVTAVTFEAQRTDDKKSMVVVKLVGYEPTVQGVRLLALRQPLLVDDAPFLKPNDAAKLSEQLTNFRLKTGIPIYVVTVKKLTDPSSDGITEYARQRANHWQLQDALLVIMSKEDRLIRLQTIGTVGERLPDAHAQELIDGVFMPHFKASDFHGGLESGLQAAMKELAR